MIKLTIIIPVYNQEELVIKALNSIPSRSDIEIIVIDDATSDDTWNKLLQYRDNHITDKNIILLYNEVNKGVAYTVNKGYDNANGEYIVLLGSDDYFITDEFIKILDLLHTYDLIYFNLRVNSGNIWYVNEKTKNGLCGSVKFMRKDFINNIRCNIDLKAGEDYYFYKELLKNKPSELFTNMTIKHYNYPRKGSLSDVYFKKS